MKRMLALLLILFLPLPALAEKADSFPAALLVKYTVKDKLNQQTYLSWEYVQTAQPAADEEINGLVDGFVAQIGLRAVVSRDRARLGLDNPYG